jgi:hypothetical protein
MTAFLKYWIGSDVSLENINDKVPLWSSILPNHSLLRHDAAFGQALVDKDFMRKAFEELMAKETMGIAFLVGTMSHVAAAIMDVLAEMNYPIPCLGAVTNAEVLSSTDRFPWF